jgi:hypothetical protein
MRRRPITLRLRNSQPKTHLLPELLAPKALVVRLRDLHISGAAASNVDPGLQVIDVGTLLGVDESVLGGRGDFGARQDGGDEDAGVVGGVAGVEDVG